MGLSPFLLLCSAGLFAIFSSTISKSPVLPLFASHLGADPSQVGLVASVSAFTGIIASIPAGLFSDRLGRRRMLLFSAAVFASAPFLYLIVRTLWQLALVRFYHGFATAVFIPVAMALVAEIFHADRGEKIGWFSTSTLLGRFVAPLAGGTVLGLFALSPDAGYRAVYLLCGFSGVLAFLIVLRLPDERPGAQALQDWPATLAAFRSALGSRMILATAAAEAAILFAYGAFETFLPLHALRSGQSAYTVGIFLSAQVITLALTKPFMGRFSDRHGRPPQIIAGALLGAGCIGSLGFTTSFIPLLGVSILFGLSLSVVTSATTAFIADLSRKENLGSAMGILGSVMDIGHTTGPLIAGFLAASWGLAASFMGASVVLAGAAVLFQVIAVEARKAE